MSNKLKNLVDHTQKLLKECEKDCMGGYGGIRLSNPISTDEEEMLEKYLTI